MTDRLEHCTRREREKRVRLTHHVEHVPVIVGLLVVQVCYSNKITNSILNKLKMKGLSCKYIYYKLILPGLQELGHLWQTHQSSTQA